MIPEYQALIKQSLLKKAQYERFLKRLKAKKPKNLDELSSKHTQLAFESIDCLQCANCCATTGPLWTKRDIERVSKLMKQSVAQFTDAHLRMDEDQDMVLKSLPCRFLAEDHYCQIYDHRPKACAEYPHTDHKKLYQIGGLTMDNLAICPAVGMVLDGIKQELNMQ